MRRPTSSLLPPFVRLVVLTLSRSVSDRRLDCAPLWRVITPPPRGPRSSPGYSVPNRHHLFGPTRPTRGHIAISPHGGLYAMPSLCGSAEATREWFRAFAIHSVLAYRPSPSRGSSIIVSSSAAMSTRPSPRVDRLGTPRTPAIRFTRAMTFVASWFTHLLRSGQLARPLHEFDRLPSQRGFYIRASSGLVALPAAGYNYNSDWTPLLAGLSPARMAASLAAPTPSS